MSIRSAVLSSVIVSTVGVAGCVDGAEAPTEVTSEPLNAMDTGKTNVAGGHGWQGKFTFNASGLSGLFFHYGCPATFPVAQSGGFASNNAAIPGMVIVGNGPRLDLTPTAYSEWAWNFRWASVAAAGAAISFDVYCVAGPA